MKKLLDVGWRKVVEILIIVLNVIVLALRLMLLLIGTAASALADGLALAYYQLRVLRMFVRYPGLWTTYLAQRRGEQEAW